MPTACGTLNIQIKKHALLCNTVKVFLSPKRNKIANTISDLFSDMCLWSTKLSPKRDLKKSVNSSYVQSDIFHVPNQLESTKFKRNFTSRMFSHGNMMPFFDHTQSVKAIQ